MPYRARRPRKLTEGQLFAVRLMDHLVVPTFVLGPDGKVLIWNRACERLTGLAGSEVIGTSEHWRAFYDQQRPCLADLVLTGGSAQVTSLYEQHESAPGQISLSAENWCGMPKLGQRRYLAIDAGPIYAETGELIAVVETVRDITAQHEAQLALEVMASVDGLTDIANRRRFDEVLSTEWRRAQRDRLPLGLLMVDVDHFKRFNDMAGHQAGDECLRQIACAIAGEALRPGDQAARYGGEEFAVILPNTSVEGGVVVADRVMAAVRDKSIRHPDPVSGPFVTVSVGVSSTTPMIGSKPELLLRSADRALYEAKRGGRAKVASLVDLRLAA